MKTSVMTRNKGQVYSVGNYLMTGKVLGKGHFARVEEATHRIIGKKVAIKIIDLTCIKEEYARRNLHREPTVMARLRHPCIAALYETMMHGPRLYMVMEAATGGDLCALVLNSRGAGARGLPEARARGLAAQLVSAVRHMHSRGVVHRDLKMENIMLDASKTFIKIVDFGLSNVWSSSGGLRTPCGSLEYAAPELFTDQRRYGPELDLWSVGVIVYGMVTGGLPFVGAGAEAEGRSRPRLRAAIARGFARQHRAALLAFSAECRTFIQQLLDPNVETRMKIEEAARHRWLRRPGLKMRTHPLAELDPKANKEIYKQISEQCGAGIIEIVQQIKSDPYGSVAGMYNIKAHLSQLNALPPTDPLWSTVHEPRPATPPEYRPHRPVERPSPQETKSKDSKQDAKDLKPTHPSHLFRQPYASPKFENGDCPKFGLGSERPASNTDRSISRHIQPHVNPKFENGDCPKFGLGSERPASNPDRCISAAVDRPKVSMVKMDKQDCSKPAQAYSLIRPVRTKPVYKVCDNGDCIESRLPSIAEHRKLDEARWPRIREPVTKPKEDQRRKLATCPARMDTRAEFYRRAGDALPSRRASGTGSSLAPQARILLQNNSTTIKRASLGNIVSPHSSINGQCKSERAMPVGWYSTRSITKDTTPLQRLRRTAPIK